MIKTKKKVIHLIHGLFALSAVETSRDGITPLGDINTPRIIGVDPVTCKV